MERLLFWFIYWALGFCVWLLFVNTTHIHELWMAGLASALSDIEREAARGVTPGPRHLGRREDFPDVIKESRVGGEVRTRRTTDGFLIDLDQPFDGAEAVDDSAFGRGARLRARWVGVILVGLRGVSQMSAHKLDQSLTYQTGLSRA